MVKKLFTLLFTFLAFTALAQETKSNDTIQNTIQKNRFYIQITGGPNITMAEANRFTPAKDYFRGCGSLSFGYERPYFGLSLMGTYNRNVQASAGSADSYEYNPFNSIVLSLNFNWNLLNTLGGLDASRKSGLYLYAGAGTAISTHVYNATAADYANNLTYTVRGGLTYAYLFSKRVSFVAEAGIDLFGDEYNGIVGGRPYELNLYAQVGFRFDIGKQPLR